MVVDPGVLGEFGRQVWREYVREVGILVGDFCGSFLGNQAGYLRPSGRIDIEQGGTEGRNVNYESFWKKLGFSKFIFHLEVSQDYSERLEGEAINF